MKFTETIASQLTPEWRSQYIDYQGLRDMLDQLRNKLNDRDMPTAMKDTLVSNFDVDFFARLMEELSKVNTFFLEKLAEATRKHTAIMAQIRESLQKQNLSAYKMLVKRKLVHSFKFLLSEHYLSLTLIDNYQSLNYTGFRKICKKHDKITGKNYGQKWMDRVIAEAPFHMNFKVPTMMEETENAFIHYLEDGDRTRAMKRLRVPPLSDRQSPSAIFRSGLFLGISIVLLVCCILGPPIDTLSNKRMFVRLYTPAVLLVLLMFFLSLNVHYWRNAGINHILIFEIDPRRHLTAIDLLEIAGMLCILLLLSILGFLYHLQMHVPRYVWPLALDLLIVVYMLNPIPIFKMNSRFWLMNHMLRTVCAPWLPVRFADFWIGDQMCSLVSCFAELAFTICFYLQLADWNNVPGECQCENETWAYLTVARILPYWFRFAQCLRRYYDNQHEMGHIINACKYTTSVLAIVWTTVYAISTDSYGNSWNNPFLICLIFFATFSAVYCLAYDLRKDWGFFESKKVFLRSHLVYRPKFCYYLAILENTLIRFKWVVPIVIVSLANPPNVPIFVPMLLDFSEIFRRFVWNFLRLENEHLNNVGKYRAVRDIQLKPILRTSKYEE